MPEELKTMPSLMQSQPLGVDGEACLSDDEILAFTQGELPASMVERVHLHVDHCDVCQRLVAESARAMDLEPPVESGRTSWNTVFQPNALIGRRYRILKLVGRGGMGEVYEAFDVKLRERVALKTVTSTACDSARAVRNLMAEVQLARRITHPNVCRIYDLGTHSVEQTGAEIHFLVMEFVDGECLGKMLRSCGALSVEVAQSVARQLLLGLRAAHQAGILHRDFKSENVMLRTEPDGQITAIILDFGLARALNESGSIATTQAQGQALVGTIGYMAPEQIEGEALTCSSDLYAFGVVWYEMLTGRLPFDSLSLTASAVARLHRDAEAPSKINPRVPKLVDAIVLRCLSRLRSCRYADAQQVLDALAAIDTDTLRPQSTRLPRRGAPLFAVALLVAALGQGLYHRHSKQPAETSANPWSTVPFLALGQPRPPLPLPRTAWAGELRAPTVSGVRPPRAPSNPLPAPSPVTSAHTASPLPNDSTLTKTRPKLLPLWSTPTRSEAKPAVD